MKMPELLGNGRRRGFIMIAALALTQAAAAAAAAFATRSLFGDLHSAEEIAFAAVAVLAASGVVIGAARIAFAVVGERIGQDYAHEIRQALLSHASGLTATDIAARRPGYVALRFVGDLNAFRMWIARGAPQAISAAIQIPTMIAVLTFMEPEFGATSAIAFGIAALITLASRDALVSAHGALRSRRAAIAADMTDLMPVAPELSQLGRTKREARRLRERTAKMVDASVRQTRRAEFLVAIADAVSASAAGAILYLAYINGVAPGAVAGALAALGIGAVALRSLAQSADHFGAFAVAEQKCTAALSRGRARPRRGTVPLPDGPLSLVVNGLTTPTGERVSLSLGQGEAYWLENEARGSVDYVFSALLGRERCQSGEVRIGGFDLRDIDPRSLQRRVALVSASPLIIKASVRCNLTLGIEQRPSDDRLLDALRKTGACARLLSLDETIAAGGVGLDPRERLHISMARAYLKTPGLLLECESATSMLNGVEAEQFRQITAGTSRLLG